MSTNLFRNFSIVFFILIVNTLISFSLNYNLICYYDILCIICPKLINNNNNAAIKKNVEKKMRMLNEYFFQVALKYESHHPIDTLVFFRER